MNDHYPTVDADFIINKLTLSDKIIMGSTITIGRTTTFIKQGTSPIFKRQITIRANPDGQMGFMQATGIAAVMGFMHDLLKWFEDERGWKEGEYIN